MGAEPGLTDAALGDGATVLLMGQGDLWEDALVEALTRHGLFVEHVGADDVVTSAIAAAPDIIVLIGDATGEQSERILRELAGAQTTSIVPVVLLARDDALDDRLRAYRHGAVAVVRRSSSVDEMATRIRDLIREIPERPGEAVGEMGEATLDEFVDVIQRELRSGILSLKSSGRDDTLVRMVLGKGRDVARIVDEFVSRVQPLVKSAETVRYEFHEQAPGTLEQLDAGSPRREPREGDVHGMRVVIADDDPGRADEVAQALRSQGASVAVVRPDGIDVERVQQLDPEVIILGEEEAEAPGVDAIHRMRQHVRLRWARLLVVRWRDLWVAPSKLLTLSRLIDRLVQLGAPERELRQRMATGVAFDTRIEITGPARLLRVLSTTERPLRATATSLRGRIAVDTAEGLIVGASGRSATEPALEGDKAIAAMLVLTSARVHIEPVHRPAVANLMATVDIALTRAASEVAGLPAGWNVNPSVAPPRLASRLSVAATVPEVPAPPLVPDPPSGQRALDPPSGPRVMDPPAPRRAQTLMGLMPPIPTGAAAARLAPPEPAPPAVALRRPTTSPGIPKPPRRPMVPSGASSVSALRTEPHAALLDPPAPTHAPAPPIPEDDEALELEEISPANEGTLDELPQVKHDEHDEQTVPAFEPPTGLVEPAPSLLVPTVTERAPAAVEPDFARAPLAVGRPQVAGARSPIPWVGVAVGAVFIFAGIAAALVIVILSWRDDGVAAARPLAPTAAAMPPATPIAFAPAATASPSTPPAPPSALAPQSSRRPNTITGEPAPDVRAIAGRVRRQRARTLIATADRGLRRGRFHRASALYTDALTYVPRSDAAVRGLSEARLRLRDHEGALVWARRLVELRPRSADSHMVLGDALLASGDHAGALEAWRTALRLHPTHRAVRFRLRRALRDR